MRRRRGAGPCRGQSTEHTFVDLSDWKLHIHVRHGGVVVRRDVEHAVQSSVPVAFSFGSARIAACTLTLEGELCRGVGHTSHLSARVGQSSPRTPVYSYSVATLKITRRRRKPQRVLEPAP